MIRRAGEMRLEYSPHLKGGRGISRVLNILEPEELHGQGRLFGVSILPPGATIGRHTHIGDFETYYILHGKAIANDNGTLQELGPGDMIQCKAGDFHAIENIGDDDLQYIAAILYTETQKPDPSEA